MRLRPAIGCVRPVGVVVLAGWLLCGCSTPGLDSARHDFYSGRFARANETLATAKAPEKDEVLFYMERGTVRQGLGLFDDSTKDFVKASDLIDRFETYSLTKGAASWVVNDSTENFRGTPYERTLLHAFTALNHLAQTNWDNAAVESRRIIKTLNPETRGKYPEDAFSRYMAGFGLELIDDDSNAALQYRDASRLARQVRIDENTGHPLPKPVTTNTADAAASGAREKPWPSELVCFVFTGRSPTHRETWERDWTPGIPLYAELRAGEQVLGRSYILTDTDDLAFQTEKLQALQKAAKTAARVVVKDVIADQVEQQDEFLGAVTRLILFAMEQPDIRRWETLPRWLQVARVPCPPDLEQFEIVLKTSTGATYGAPQACKPVSRRNNTLIAFWRDITPRP